MMNATVPSWGRRLLAFGTDAPWTGVERTTLLWLAAGATVIGGGFAVLVDDVNLPSSLFRFGLTLIFVVFVWSAAVAASALVGAMVLSISFDMEIIALLAMAVAVGCVVRVGTVGLVATYAGAFFLASTALVEGAAHVLNLSGFVASLIVAVVAGAIGLLLRLAAEREQRLQARVESVARALQEAAMGERLRLADELHDVIAHDLTVVAMHARVLESEISDEVRAESQSAIGTSARKALEDLRRVVEHAQSSPLLAEAPPMDLDQTFAATSRELSAANYAVEIRGASNRAQLPRLVDGALARILLESTTNILKHGEPGPVQIAMQVSAEAVEMTVRSPIRRQAQPRALPSGGYGTVRMAARAHQLGGTCDAGEETDVWIVRAFLPIRARPGRAA
ncbi:MAG: sensor histidine kinase [Pseudoclavibacter sp.]